MDGDDALYPCKKCGRLVYNPDAHCEGGTDMPEKTVDDATNFANALLGDWHNAMGRFFREVERSQANYGLTNEQVRDALRRGYGEEVADEWDEWIED